MYKVKINNLIKSFGTGNVLNGIDMSVKERKSFALLGRQAQVKVPCFAVSTHWKLPQAAQLS